MKDVLAANDWPNGVDSVVVDDVGSSPRKIGGFFNRVQDTNLSFNLGSLDPDLAATRPTRMTREYLESILHSPPPLHLLLAD